MDSRRDTRRQEVAELQLQLANASRLLDEVEKRSLASGSLVGPLTTPKQDLRPT
jgi:hypothetical protein